MPQKLTIKEIAELAGVSKATVSRVINGKPGVNPETRKKVEQVIQAHSYAPNLVARGLSLRQTGNIGLIVAHSAKRLSSHLFFLEFLQGVSRYLTKKGIRLTLMTADSEEDYESSCLNMAQGGFVDGAIILGIRKNDRRLKYFLKTGVPFVTVGRPIGYPKADYVDSDNQGGAKMATEYLLRLGHKEILFINGPRDHVASIARERGYREAFTAHGIAVNDQYIVHEDFSFESGYETVRAALAQGQKLSAVFAASDLTAMGAATALKEAGLRVGKDVSVVGFDDIPYAPLFDPPLTTVHQPIQKMGQETGRLILIRANGAAHSPLTRVFPTQLVVRESTIRG